MIQTKIFTILEVAKNIDSFAPGYKQKAVTQILQEIKADHPNINDAFVILDFLKDVSTELTELIKEDTIKNVRENGDTSALGVQLYIEKIKEYNYQGDRDWNDINKKVSIYQDALKKREKGIQDAVKQSIEDGTASPVAYLNSYSIIPRVVTGS